MIIIQLLKDTKYPANYQIIIDSSLGNYAVLRDFFSALHEGHGRPRSVRKSSRLRCKSFSMDCICSDRRKSIGPSAPIAYATSVSPPDEAVAWPGVQVLGAGGCCRLAGDTGAGCRMMLFPAKGADVG